GADRVHIPRSDSHPPTLSCRPPRRKRGPHRPRTPAGPPQLRAARPAPVACEPRPRAHGPGRSAGAMSDAANNHLGHDGGTYPDSYYVRLGEDRLVSTLHSQGAWQPGEQHLAPASGLVLAEIERRLPSDKLVSRATFDVLGVIHSGE